MEACEMDWRPIPALPLEDLLPDLSVEEQVRVQSKLREEERIRKRFESRAYDARKGGEFDVVKSFMESTVHFKGEVWYHINFWARSRSSSKIKRFFAEVHYKRPASNSVRSDLPIRIPIDQLLARSSVYSDQPEAEVHNRQSASRFVCSDQPVPVPEAETHDMPPSSSSVWPVLHRIPIVEVCTIIEEPLGRYRRSCAFCRGHLDILHPKGSRKFVCGNDKDRMVQQLVPRSNHGCGQPFKMPPW